MSHLKAYLACGFAFEKLGEVPVSLLPTCFPKAEEFCELRVQLDGLSDSPTDPQFYAPSVVARRRTYPQSRPSTATGASAFPSRPDTRHCGLYTRRAAQPLSPDKLSTPS